MQAEGSHRFFQSRSEPEQRQVFHSAEKLELSEQSLLAGLYLPNPTRQYWFENPWKVFVEKGMAFLFLKINLAPQPNHVLQGLTVSDKLLQ